MKACYPGTFDPITLGHLDVIERAAKMFEELDVLIMKNPRKKCTFTEEERKEMIEECLKDKPYKNKVKVVIGSGLTVDYAGKLGAGVIIRGIRAVSDYEYEFQQATANQTLDPNIETLFMIAQPKYSFLSSSTVKEIAYGGGDIAPFLPAEITEKVREALAKQGTLLL